MSKHTFTNSDLEFLPAFEQMCGPKPPDWFESNGATLAPDILFGIDIRPAAHFHDYAYSSVSLDVTNPKPRDESMRYLADQRFLINLRRCGLGIWSWAYYYRVRLWGHFAYSYSPGCKPKRTFWFWWKLLLGRYVQW